MADEGKAPWEPNWAVHPGEILAEALEDAGLSARLAAVALGVPEPDLLAVLGGSAPITAELAERLAARLPVSRRLWLRLQEVYDDAVERLAHG